MAQLFLLILANIVFFLFILLTDIVQQNILKQMFLWNLGSLFYIFYDTYLFLSITVSLRASVIMTQLFINYTLIITLTCENTFNNNKYFIV